MIELRKEEKQEIIAKNVAVILDMLCKRTLVVNLGIGIPLLTVNYLNNENIYIQTENGMVGVGPLAKEGEEHPDLINAGRQSITETPGCIYTDCSEAFGMLRGGHLGAAVLGVFEVDGEGTVSNWIIPGGTLLGVGGAMDLVCGAETLIVAMTHTNGDQPKMVKECKLPVTAYHEADYVVTEMCVIHFIDNKPVLEKLHPSATVEEVRALTEFEFAVSDELTEMVV